MSLQYIIDGYNIIHHPAFSRSRPLCADVRLALIRLIKDNRLCGSRNNAVAVVFDGVCPTGAEQINDQGPRVYFSRAVSADDLIRELVERARNPRIIVVVSDDKQVCFLSRACGARTMGVADFLGQGRSQAAAGQKTRASDAGAPEITHSQMHKVNKELRKLWLKE